MRRSSNARAITTRLRFYLFVFALSNATNLMSSVPPRIWKTMCDTRRAGGRHREAEGDGGQGGEQGQRAHCREPGQRQGLHREWSARAVAMWSGHALAADLIAWLIVTAARKKQSIFGKTKDDNFDESEAVT